MEDAEEAELPVELSRVFVRLIIPEERERWDALMREHHYLGLNALVGRSLRYVAQYQNRWLALVGWASAALKCEPRDTWIGWSAALQWQRLRLIANNSRFLLLPGPRVKNLASRILGLNLVRLSEDWQRVHGHRLLLAETFIDPSRFAGTCYRAANWLELGATRGFAKSNRTYVAHGEAKRILLYALHPRAAELLSSAWPHPDLPCLEIKPMMTLTDAEAADLLTRIGRIDDPRKLRGRRHTQRSVLACILCAVVSGARGSTEISEWIERMTPAMLRQLRCRRNAASQYERPSESTVRRLLQQMPIEALENALGGWLQTQVAARAAQNSEAKKKLSAIALDGKTLRGSHDGEAPNRQLLAVLEQGSRVVLNQVEIPAKGSEIQAVEPALKSLDIAARVVTLDALHTQVDTARYIVEEKKAHYLLTVKDNQQTLKEDIAQLNLQAGAPHFVTQEKGHGRLEIRRIWTSTALQDYLTFPYAAQVACVQREILHISQQKTTLETVYLISSQSPAEATAEQLLGFNRGHWGIEALHHVRDRAYDEDHCRARKGHAPRALACLRNFAISLLRLLKVKNIAAALRQLAADAGLVLKVLGV